MSETNNSKASSFLKGATILAVAGIISRLLGLFYKIPLYRLVGSYGNGIFGNVTSIYNTLLMISTVGIPVAISKMISEALVFEDYRGIRDIFRIALILLCVIGGVSTLFLFFGADWLIEASGWPAESYASVMAIAAAPFIIAVCTAFRGYFQGFQIMKPTAISQIIEQIIRVGLGIFLAWFCIYNGYGVGQAVGGAILGATVGGLAAMLSLLVMFYFLMYSRPEIRDFAKTQPVRMTTKQILKRFLYIAIPITLTAAIGSFAVTFDSLMYVGQLAKAGIAKEVATAMFGDYTNVDMMISVPLIISANLAVAMIPAISESFAIKDQKNMNAKIDISLRLVIMVAMPCCVGYFLLSKGIFDLLFPGSAYGPGLLAVFAFVALFMMISSICQNVLQAIDKMRIPLINLIICLIIRTILCYFLLAIPSVNIYAVGISSIVMFGFQMAANFYFVKHFTKIKINWVKTVVVPLVASIIMGGICWLSYTGINAILGNTVAVLLSIIISGIVYIMILFISGVVEEEELCAIPGGRFLMPIYRKVSVKDRKGKKE